jgi:secondary thiamine-phosphate synthase enzyme
MIQKFFDLIIKTKSKKLYDFTSHIEQWIIKNSFKNGIINISIQHTSASLIVQENTDPDVQADLLTYFDKLVPMNDDLYTHTTEGKDDMPAHIRSSLTNNQINLSVKDGNLLLGAWQGVYLFEHRLSMQRRFIVLHFLGD